VHGPLLIEPIQRTRFALAVDRLGSGPLGKEAESFFHIVITHLRTYLGEIRFAVLTNGNV